MAALSVWEKLSSLLTRRAFTVKPSIFPTKQPNPEAFSYGPPGALLRHNILQEWRRYVLFKSESTFWVENSKDFIVKTLPKICPGSHQLHTSLLRYFPENYLAITKQLNKKLPFSVAFSSVDCQENPDNSRCPLPFTENTKLTVAQFCPSSNIVSTFNDCHRQRLKWWRQYARFPSNFILSDPHELNVDNETFQMFNVKFHFPWGWDTVETIINWQCYPLRCLNDGLTSDLTSPSKIRRLPSLPSVIECTAVLDTAFIAFLLDSFHESNLPNPKKKSNSKTRNILKLHRKLAPYKIGVSVTGSRMSYLRNIALRIIKDIEGLELQLFHCLDSTNSLEKQYEMFDELGVLFIIVINDATLESGIVGIRSRDTSLKEPHHIASLKDTISRNVFG
ncbi:DNA polymerase subunit gamma-2, mitochondrial-like, partial [Argonauta hians]